MSELTQQGIVALKAGDRVGARRLLYEALKQDQDDAQAWLWLSGAMDKDEERIACLRQVLRIDPTNSVAARGLAQINERRSQSTGQAAPASAPAAASNAVPTGDAVAAASLIQTAETGTLQAPAPDDTAAPAATAALAAAAAGISAEPVQSISSSESAVMVAPSLEAPAETSETAKPGRRARKREKPVEDTGQPVFRTRPSQVPALLGFWVFLFGATGIAYLLRDVPAVATPLSASLFLLFELVVIFVVMRNFSRQYELTTLYLTMPFRGRRTRINVSDVLGAECCQTGFQKMLGSGDIILDVVVKGELSHLRLRNIPECQKRTRQIIELIPKQES